MEDNPNLGGTSRHEIAQMLGIREKDIGFYDNDYGCRISAVRPDDNDRVKVVSSRKGKRRSE